MIIHRASVDQPEIGFPGNHPVCCLPSIRIFSVISFESQSLCGVIAFFRFNMPTEQINAARSSAPIRMKKVCLLQVACKQSKV